MRSKICCVLLCTGWLWVAIGIPARSQDIEQARRRYVSLLGLENERLALQEHLRTELDGLGYENAENLSRFFSFVMLTHGIDRDKVARLEAGGIDVVHAMTSNARPFMEQGLFSDPAVVGEVVAIEDSDEPGDGQGSTVRVRVLETLKGTVHADTIVLRQRRRSTEGLGPRGFVPEVGSTYLLLLSRPLYKFFVWRRTGADSEPREPRPGYYAIYRTYLVDDGRVVMGDGSMYTSDQVYQELRWLDELVNEL